jgi:predicted dehydrogenase
MLGQGSPSPGTNRGDVRMAIVGCGRQAERGHVPAAARARGVALVAIADTERSRCEGAAPGTRAYGSIEELLASEALDAVVIATPTAHHLSCARVAARAGIPALVEKPPATDAAEAAELASVSPAPRLGFNRRFDPELESLRRQLAEPGQFDLKLRLDFPIRAWRPHVAHDDVLLDLGTHLVDLVRWLTRAEVERVRARASSPKRVSLELELPTGRAALECAGNRFWREEVIAEDRDRRRIAAQVRGGLGRVALARLGLRRHDDGFVTSLARQLEAFAAELRGGGETQLARAGDGVAALAVVDGARESERAGGEWRPVAASVREGVA